MKHLAPAAFVGLLLAGAAPAATFSYTADLSGAAESPPVATTGTGSALIDYDDVAQTLWVRFTFADLIGALTAAHLHGPTATAGTGVAGVITPTPTFPGTPVGTTSGSYDHIFDLTDTTSYNAGFISMNGGTAASAEAALAAALAAGTVYLNLHSTFAPGGEIRGFLTVPSQVPLPATLPLLLAGLAAFRLTRRRR